MNDIINTFLEIVSTHIERWRDELAQTDGHLAELRRRQDGDFTMGGTGAFHFWAMTMARREHCLVRINQLDALRAPINKR
jgi:hypothetical protein